MYVNAYTCVYLCACIDMCICAYVYTHIKSEQIHTRYSICLFCFSTRLNAY